MPSLAFLPNLLTLGSVVSAVIGLLSLSRPGGVAATAVAMLCLSVCLVCDVLDGKLARKLGLSSPMGAQLDSLADLLAFGVLPAFAAARAMRPTWEPDAQVSLVTAAFVVAVVVRLARYSEVGLIRNRFGECFVGLPSSVAAIVLMAALVAQEQLHWPSAMLGAVALVLALLMNMRFPFPKRGVGFYPWVLLVPVLLAIVWWPVMRAG
ncbi:CDP-alcohol phosphatidyltransferase family protein [Roseateles cellulosilyticus]|uniref:CDP-alcohol phosphatidyltransferase family protein n=1 Tax=Pelomonas cellulosilytica TaxID=2906762 RepID=A0ABS8XSN7_9BURK|nr:CDP-alcohol phosphatidyltransferase family protein [Pelomonas sp. P8]MCE4554305.1 CDP-alcohol phosphatidyltransferase family protein [Pelomonas sp. P8]